MYNMQDALISAESLAMLAGTTPETKIVQVHKKEVLTLGADLKVTLTETPTAALGHPMFVFVTSLGHDIGVTVPVNLTNGYQIAAKELTFAGVVEGHTFAQGDHVIIDYYYDSAATAKQITIDSDKFPPYVRIEADTVWTREHDGALLPAKFTMPRVKISSSFTISNAAEGDPSVFDFVAEVFPDNNNKMVVIDVIE